MQVLTGRNACPTFMQELLEKMVGRKIDVYCGGASSLRGEVIKVEGGVLHLKDNDQKLVFVAVAKITVVWDARDDDHRAGFVPFSGEK